MAILFTTSIAFGLIIYVTAFANSKAISLLGGTTSLLLLAVFAVVNVAVLVLRRDVQAAGGHFKTPTVLPVIGCHHVAVSRDAAVGAAGAAVRACGHSRRHRHRAVLRHHGDQPRLGVRDAGITDPTHLADAPD